jgi:hypothetical protein
MKKKLFEEIDENNVADVQPTERDNSINERDSGLRDNIIDGWTSFKHLKIRPVTLSTLALLEQVGSSLVTGNVNADHVTDALVFLWIQSGDRSDVIKACSNKNIALIQEKAFELGDELEIGEIEQVVEVVSEIMQASGKTKVIPIPKDEEDNEGDDLKNK